MSSVKRIYLAVAGGLVATGLVLAAIGFVASGFNLAVFNTQIDLRDDTIILGGVEIDDPTGLPLIEQLAEVGEIHIGSATTGSSSPSPLRAHHDGHEHTALGVFLRDLPSRSSCVVNRSSTDERLMGISRLRANPAHRSGLPS